MKKYISMFSVLALLVMPFVSGAVDADIDPNPTDTACVSLAYNLRYQSRDIATNGEVSTLQDFLQSNGYLNNEPTGYFGLLTLKAVKSFQGANSIEPTGYVGPITRAKIQALTCGDIVPIERCSLLECPPVIIGCPPGAMYSSQTGRPCKDPAPVPMPTSSITVISPNGGESWKKTGVVSQSIDWQDNTLTPVCDNCDVSSTELKYYDVMLQPYYPPCTSRTCPAYMYRDPYFIAPNTPGSVYPNGRRGIGWIVGSVLKKNAAGNFTNVTAPDGKYLVQVCQVYTNICDTSDGPFTITGGTETGQKLSITGDFIDSDSLKNAKAGESYKAILLADGAPYGTCTRYSWMLFYDTSLPQGLTLSSTDYDGAVISGTPTTAGYYEFTLRVSCGSLYGTRTIGLKVDVGNTTTSSITVLAPNGGNILTKGETQKIRWDNDESSSNNTYIELVPASYGIGDISAYSIVNNLSSSTFYWEVGKGLYNMIVPDGRYKIRVCDLIPGHTGSYRCDESDSSFKIISEPAPVISCSISNNTEQYFETCSEAGFDNVCFSSSGVFQGCTKNSNNDCTVNNLNATTNILCPVPA
jgi:hypothetical protein